MLSGYAFTDEMSNALQAYYETFDNDTRQPFHEWFADFMAVGLKYSPEVVAAFCKAVEENP